MPVLHQNMQLTRFPLTEQDWPANPRGVHSVSDCVTESVLDNEQQALDAKSLGTRPARRLCARGACPGQ